MHRSETLSQEGPRPLSETVLQKLLSEHQRIENSPSSLVVSQNVRMIVQWLWKFIDCLQKFCSQEAPAAHHVLPVPASCHYKLPSQHLGFNSVLCSFSLEYYRSYSSIPFRTRSVTTSGTSWAKRRDSYKLEDLSTRFHRPHWRVC